MCEVLCVRSIVINNKISYYKLYSFTLSYVEKPTVSLKMLLSTRLGNFFFARDINRIIGRHRNVVKLQANYCPCEPFIIFKGKCPKWCTLRHNKWHFHITPKGQRKVCNSICVWSSTLLFSFALEKIRMWVSKVDSNKS